MLKNENSPLMVLRLKNVLQNLVDKGITDFYSYTGTKWDLIAANEVITLKLKYPHIRLHISIPNRTQKSSGKNMEKYRRVLFNATDVEYVEYIPDEYSHEKIKQSYEKMIEKSDCCIYFLKKGLCVINLL